MSNQLKLTEVQAIHALHQRGWSQRRIAKELGIDRAAVSRYVGTALHRNDPSVEILKGERLTRT